MYVGSQEEQEIYGTRLSDDTTAEKWSELQVLILTQTLDPVVLKLFRNSKVYSLVYKCQGERL